MKYHRSGRTIQKLPEGHCPWLMDTFDGSEVFVLKPSKQLTTAVYALKPIFLNVRTVTTEASTFNRRAPLSKRFKSLEEKKSAHCVEVKPLSTDVRKVCTKCAKLHRGSKNMEKLCKVKTTNEAANRQQQFITSIKIATYKYSSNGTKRNPLSYLRCFCLVSHSLYFAQHVFDRN